MYTSTKLLLKTGVGALVVIPIWTYAETYSLITDIPGFIAASEAGSQGIAPFINSLYQMSIGIGAALAVLIIILSGIQYSLSSVAGTKVDLKQRILYALGGLMLLLSAYLLLNIINPQLTNLEPSELKDSNFSKGETEINKDFVSSDGVLFTGGQSESEIFEFMENPTVADYEATFGRAPFPGRVKDGRVQLTSAERTQLIERYTTGNIGVTSDAPPHIYGDVVTDDMVEVSIDGQRAVAAAISICPSIPRDWVESIGLYKIIDRESKGIVGRPNYAMAGYMKAYGVPESRMTKDIQRNRFYTTHCCRVTSQSSREAAENKDYLPCDPNTDSKLMDYTRSMAAAGKKGYSHIAGQCASAAGVGQLLNKWMVKYQPSGVAGYNNGAEEICGMLGYIKENYGNPENAWAKYVSGKGY